jgi:hypothetical protein
MIRARFGPRDGEQILVLFAEARQQVVLEQREGGREGLGERIRFEKHEGLGVLSDEIPPGEVGVEGR